MRQFLERVDRIAVANEPDHVPGNPARDIDEPLVAPRLERKMPWQVEEIRVTGAPAHLEVDSLRDHSSCTIAGVRRPGTWRADHSCRRSAHSQRSPAGLSGEPKRLHTRSREQSTSTVAALPSGTRSATAAVPHATAVPAICRANT